MEGTQADTPAAPIPTPAPKARWTWPLLVLAVAVIVIAGVTSVYFLTPPPPIPLVVADGSTEAAIEGNLTGIGSTSPGEYYFNATTYANQSQGPSSSLSLRLVVDAGFLASPSDPSSGEWLMHIAMTGLGRFAANLRPSQLTLAVNGTSANLHVDSEDSYLTGANVTFNPQPIAYFIDNGSASVAATPASPNPTGLHVFSFSDEWRIDEYLSFNGTYGFRATVIGDFTPAVSVGILLNIINLPA